MKTRIKSDLLELMMVPGLSGHEDLIRAEIRTKLEFEGIQSSADRLGNLISTFKGDPGPSVICLLYTSPSPRDMRRSRLPSSA